MFVYSSRSNETSYIGEIPSRSMPDGSFLLHLSTGVRVSYEDKTEEGELEAYLVCVLSINISQAAGNDMGTVR